MGSWVDACIKGFELSGWDVTALFKASGVDPLVIKQNQCPAADVNRLFNCAETLFNSPSVGIAARRGVTPSTFHAISLAAMASANLWDGLQQLVRFNVHITNVVRFSLSREPSAVVFQLQTIEGAPMPSVCALDAVLSTTIKTCRFIQPHPPAIQRIELARCAPENASEFTRYFKVPLLWNSPHYAIHFDAAYLSKASMHHNPILLAEYERMCLMHFPLAESLQIIEKTRRYLRSQLQRREGCPTALDTAAALELSERSLQRYLHQQQTSFRRLLDEALLNESKHLLITTTLTVSQVAHVLGFTDSSNFSRAFKRWLNCSPNEYRNQHGLPAKRT